ncbi:hypothetical protein AHP1_641 [Aeromonas phage Ahp1_CNU-2021]|nr:hypothetical protein AHP1_641 [Aeromonas phage Ahp1_CNU-2021]
MKTFDEYLAEAKGLSTADKQKIAKDIVKEMSDDDDVNELIGMYLENTPGAEHATDRDHKDILKMIEKLRK